MDYIFSNLDLGTFSNCLFLQAPSRSSTSTRFVQIEVAITGFQQMGQSYHPSACITLWQQAGIRIWGCTPLLW